MKLNIVSRSGRTLAALDINEDASVEELQKKFHGLKKEYPPTRHRFTLPPKAGEARGITLEAGGGKSLHEYGLTGGPGGDTLQFKDLGPQVGYSTVFFWEYFGPLAVYPLFFLLPHLTYPWHKGPVSHAPVQLLALAYWSMHYAKRIVETFTIHRFGHATMPLANLGRNCAYYWGFAAFVSYFVNHPAYSPPSLLGPRHASICLGLAVLCQAGNLRCHLILASLRAPGEKVYKIPRGFLFNWVTCANYTFEVWGWILFALATYSLPAAVFALVGGAQMAQWAAQKHARLRKTFDGKEGRDKYPRRWIMFPPFF